MTQEQKKFIERVGALAAADMQKSGVLASLTIAQAILESGWGKSGLTVKGNALFGIKAGTSWTGAVYSGKTQECYDGVTFTTVTGLFRAYGSWAESVADHSDLLSCNARYKAVIGERDYKAACRGGLCDRPEVCRQTGSNHRSIRPDRLRRRRNRRKARRFKYHGGDHKPRRRERSRQNESV